MPGVDFGHPLYRQTKARDHRPGSSELTYQGPMKGSFFPAWEVGVIRLGELEMITGRSWHQKLSKVSLRFAFICPRRLARFSVFCLLFFCFLVFLVGGGGDV